MKKTNWGAQQATGRAELAPAGPGQSYDMAENSTSEANPADEAAGHQDAKAAASITAVVSKRANKGQERDVGMQQCRQDVVAAADQGCNGKDSSRVAADTAVVV